VIQVDQIVGRVFLARARLEGAAQLSGLAGAPIGRSDLQAWITGRSPPPRASEGLNDPISVAAVFHFAISQDEESRDPILRATLNVLRSVLDDRKEAETYGGSDLAHFGPIWRTIREQADAPFAHGDLREIAERVFDHAAISSPTSSNGAQVVTIDGRSLNLPSAAQNRGWLIGSTMPLMLQRAGITLRVIPSLILLPKFLPPTPEALVVLLEAALRKAVDAGLRDLDRIEQQARNLDTMGVTKRSKAPLLARLQIAYPGLQIKAIARLLSVTPQGARKLLATKGLCHDQCASSTSRSAFSTSSRDPPAL